MGAHGCVFSLCGFPFNHGHVWLQLQNSSSTATAASAVSFPLGSVAAGQGGKSADMLPAASQGNGQRAAEKIEEQEDDDEYDEEYDDLEGDFDDVYRDDDEQLVHHATDPEKKEQSLEEEGGMSPEITKSTGEEEGEEMADAGTEEDEEAEENAEETTGLAEAEVEYVGAEADVLKEACNAEGTDEDHEVGDDGEEEGDEVGEGAEAGEDNEDAETGDIHGGLVVDDDQDHDLLIPEFPLATSVGGLLEESREDDADAEASAAAAAAENSGVLSSKIRISSRQSSKSSSSQVSNATSSKSKLQSASVSASSRSERQKTAAGTRDTAAADGAAVAPSETTGRSGRQQRSQRNAPAAMRWSSRLGREVPADSPTSVTTSPTKTSSPPKLRSSPAKPSSPISKSPPKSSLLSKTRGGALVDTSSTGKAATGRTTRASRGVTAKVAAAVSPEKGEESAEKEAGSAEKHDYHEHVGQASKGWQHDRTGRMTTLPRRWSSSRGMWILGNDGCDGDESAGAHDKDTASRRLKRGRGGGGGGDEESQADESAGQASGGVNSLDATVAPKTRGGKKVQVQSRMALKHKEEGMLKDMEEDGGEVVMRHRVSVGGGSPLHPSVELGAEEKKEEEEDREEKADEQGTGSRSRRS